MPVTNLLDLASEPANGRNVIWVVASVRKVLERLQTSPEPRRAFETGKCAHSQPVITNLLNKVEKSLLLLPSERSGNSRPLRSAWYTVEGLAGSAALGSSSSGAVTQPSRSAIVFTSRR